MIEASLDWVVRNRNRLFLAVCMVVHALYALFFAYNGVYLLAILNLASTYFYTNFLIFDKDFSEKRIVSCYFEIILFSFLSELALGNGYGFFLLIIGMMSVVFYLAPSYKNRRFAFQLVGAGAVILIESIVVGFNVSFPQLREPLEPYRNLIYEFNVSLTLIMLVVVTFVYSTDAERVRNNLSYNMSHDTLTDLFNRRYLEMQITSVPYEKRSQYVISMLDIDDFKKVNDTYGHDAGDAVLVRVAEILREAAGVKNLAVRWGGEEFILYFPKAQLEEVELVMEEVRQKVAGSVVRTMGHEISVTITIGISYGLADSDYERVIKSADEKLYLGKRRGKNCIIT